jgi:molybdopterin-guanine dinucleotide biosynthesis protein A
MTGWILAGGLSSRFGSDKVLFLLDGRPLALRVADALRAAGLDPRLVARHPRDLGLPELIEPEGPRHPLHGVATALAHDARTGLSFSMFCPADLAELRAEQVASLLAAHCGEGSVHAASQPLLCVLPTTVAVLAERQARLDGTVRGFLAEIGARPVDLGPLRNLNRPP